MTEQKNTSVHAAAWSTPREVSDLEIAFPAHVMRLMPPYDEELEAWGDTPAAARWVQFQRDWFFRGFKPGATFTCQEGVDRVAALRQLKAIQGSYEPKHEHKELAVAYLASLFFSDVQYEAGELKR